MSLSPIFHTMLCENPPDCTTLSASSRTVCSRLMDEPRVRNGGQPRRWMFRGTSLLNLMGPPEYAKPQMPKRPDRASVGLVNRGDKWQKATLTNRQFCHSKTCHGRTDEAYVFGYTSRGRYRARFLRRLRELVAGSSLRLYFRRVFQRTDESLRAVPGVVSTGLSNRMRLRDFRGGQRMSGGSMCIRLQGV